MRYGQSRYYAPMYDKDTCCTGSRSSYHYISSSRGHNRIWLVPGFLINLNHGFLPGFLRTGENPGFYIDYSTYCYAFSTQFWFVDEDFELESY